MDIFIYEMGAWEPEILSFMRDSLRIINKNNGVFLDIVANTGQHSLYMAQYANTVHAIEPYPVALDRMREAINSNNFKNANSYNKCNTSEEG